MDEEVSTNQVVVFYWNLPDIVDLATTVRLDNLSDEEETAEEFLEPL